ncbi:MAG: glycosyltransferase family 9 protein, partial [Terriglobia bacterium]
TRWRELIELNPEITNVIAVDTRTWRRAWLRAGTWRSVAGVVGILRRARYDAALDLQGLYKSAALAWLSSAPRRYGFDYGFTKERSAGMFYTEWVRPPENAHVIEMNLALARAAGAGDACLTNRQFPLQTLPEDEAYVEDQLRRQHVGDFFFLSPGGGWGSKCWPVERYATLHNALARRYGWRSVINVGPGEEHLLREFLAHARVTRPVHFPLSLRQLVALVRRARAFVGGDTGPLHLAAALGTPAVGLYGPTDPARNGPYSSRAVVVHHRELATITYRREAQPGPALLAITVEEVLAAVERCLEAAGG